MPFSVYAEDSQADLNTVEQTETITENSGSSHATATNSSGNKNFDSEILFFAGHGDTTTMSVDGESTEISRLAFKGPGLSYEPFGANQLPDMSNVKIAVFASCHSGIIPTTSNIKTLNLAEQAVENGASWAIGWNNSIIDADASNWTDNFFTNLYESNNVESAIFYTNLNFEASNVIVASQKDYGNKQTSVYPHFFPNLFNSYNQNIEVVALEESLKEFEYEVCSMPNGVKRYVKTINGIHTRDYYDVAPNGTIARPKNSDILTKQEVAATKTKYSNIAENDINIHSESIIINSYDVYYKIDGSLTPIRVLQVMTDNGTINKYVNLTNGLEVSQEIIPYFS